MHHRDKYGGVPFGMFLGPQEAVEAREGTRPPAGGDGPNGRLALLAQQQRWQQ
jgi:hypothetical protein